MKITVNNRTCRGAVLRFVREVRDRTSFRPVIRIVRESPDVEFPGESERTFLIEWASADPDGFEEGTYDDEWESPQEPARNTTIEHYERMIRTLAANSEAARAFLDSAKGRQGRTGHRPDAPHATTR